MNKLNAWDKWRYFLLLVWLIAAAIIIFAPDYERQMLSRYTNEWYYPDDWGMSVLMAFDYGVFLFVYWVLSWVTWLRKYFIIKWLIMILVNLAMLILVGMGAMHNTSTAFSCLINIVMFNNIVHFAIVPFVWATFPRS